MRDPVTMRKLYLYTVYEANVSAATGARYSAFEKAQDRAAMLKIFASAPHPEPTSCLSSVTREDSFLCNGKKSGVDKLFRSRADRNDLKKSFYFDYVSNIFIFEPKMN